VPVFSFRSFKNRDPFPLETIEAIQPLKVIRGEKSYRKLPGLYGENIRLIQFRLTFHQSFAAQGA
jgi:hypothetical protein